MLFSFKTKKKTLPLKGILNPRIQKYMIIFKGAQILAGVYF